MVSKPEKKKVKTPEPICDTLSEIARYGQRWERGYNQACDNWEKWLKSKMKDIPPKYAKLINEHFWELI